MAELRGVAEITGEEATVAGFGVVREMRGEVVLPEVDSPEGDAAKAAGLMCEIS